MSWIDDMIVKLSGGYFSIAGLLKVSAGSIVTEKDKFVTSTGVTKVVQITGMPYYYSGDIITSLAKQARKVDKRIIVNSYIEADRCTIPINHPTYVNKMNKALQKYYEYESWFNGLDKAFQRAGVFRHNGVRMRSFGKKDVLEAKSASDSYTEVGNHIRERGGVYFLTRLFIHITYPDMHTAMTQHEGLTSYLQGRVRKIDLMDKKMGTYLLNMSPSVTNIQNIQSTNILTSQESLTSLVPFRQEGLISTKGSLLGADVDKKNPFFLDTYGTSEGSSALVTGPAGSGKTVFAYNYSLQSIPNDTTIIYLDLKGGTVGPALGKLMNDVEVVNFSGKTAKFINPLVLNRINSNYDLDDAINTTASWLELMVGLEKSEGNRLDLERILKSVIRGYYTKCGVTSTNKATYIHSHDMTLGGLLEIFRENRATTSNKDELKMYEIAAKRISALLNDYNMVDNTNAIDVATLYDSDAIVFDFDKDTETTIGHIDKIRIFSVIFFTKQLSAYNKANERFTMLCADEGNQYIMIPGLMEYISDLTARARSSNASVVFITNDLSVVSRPEMSGFMSNIAVFIAANLIDEDVRRLETMNGVAQLSSNVRKIKKNPGKYRHSFAVSTSLKGAPVNAIVRAELPPEVLKAFATRTVK